MNFNDTNANSGMTGGMGGGMGGGGMGTGTTGGGMGGGGMGGNGDALDKGVDFLERKAGHEQSHSTTEKISDGVRKGFSKLTGKNVPVQDKQYQ